MSFITLNLKTDFEKIEHLFVTFFKQEPTWAAVAETDLAFVAPVIGTILNLSGAGTASADAAVVGILASVQKDLVLATKFIQALDNSSNLTDVLNSIIANLQGLLTLSQVKSSTSVNEITSYVTGIIGEIEMILGAMPKQALKK